MPDEEGGGSASDRYFCPYPGCKRSFAELWRLKVHYRAPPDIRGSGKERGHGTELTHCPKCGKGLKPGKHHVGCSGGKAGSRQSKRAKLAGNAAVAGAGMPDELAAAAGVVAAGGADAYAAGGMLQMHQQYGDGSYGEQQQYYAAQQYSAEQLQQGAAAYAGQHTAMHAGAMPASSYLPAHLQQQQQAGDTQSPSLSMGLGGLPDHHMAAAGAVAAPSGLSTMHSGDAAALMGGQGQAPLGYHYPQQQPGHMQQQPLGLDSSGLLAQQGSLQLPDALGGAPAYGMAAGTTYLTRHPQQQPGGDAVMPLPLAGQQVVTQQHAMMPGAPADAAALQPQVVTTVLPGQQQLVQPQTLLQDGGCPGSGGLPPLPAGMLPADAPTGGHQHAGAGEAAAAAAGGGGGGISSSLFDEIDGGRVPSPPPLPPDFPSAPAHCGTLFNFAQFSHTKLPAPVGPHQQMAMMPRGMEAELPPSMDELWTPEATYDHHSDGDLMQLLFGAPNEAPTMATIHLHHFLDDDATSDPAGLLGGLLGGSLDDLHGAGEAAAAAARHDAAAMPPPAPVAAPPAAAAGGGVKQERQDAPLPAAQRQQQQPLPQAPPPQHVQQTKLVNGDLNAASMPLPNGATQCGQAVAIKAETPQQPAPAAAPLAASHAN